MDAQRGKELSKLRQLGVNMAQVSKRSKDERKKRQKESLLLSPDKRQVASVCREIENEWHKMAD